MNFTDFITNGPVVFLLTEVAKRSQFIPINQGQKYRLLALAGSLSAISVVVQGIAHGNLSVQNIQQVFLAGFSFFSTWAFADGIHRLRKLIVKKFFNR